MVEQKAKAELVKYVEHYQQCKRNCLNSYIEIASDLYNIKKSNLYMYIHKKDGSNYGSVYELIEDYFGLSKSTVNSYIGVFTRFADMVSLQIKSQNKDYSFSQLREMLSLTDSQIAKCNPSMTCEAIQELKKKDKGKVKEDTFIPDPNTSLQLSMTKELYDKVLASANRCKKNMVDFVIEVLNLYFNTLPK